MCYWAKGGSPSEGEKPSFACVLTGGIMKRGGPETKRGIPLGGGKGPRAGKERVEKGSEGDNKE